MAAAPGLPTTPQEALEFMQRMWNPLGMPLPGMPLPGMPPPGTAPAAPGANVPWPNPMSMFATLDPVEIDRKIEELRVIENWLTMSQNFMQMSIKTLELQKASLEAMRAGVGAAGGGDPGKTK
jgi:hypothetical protein